MFPTQVVKIDVSSTYPCPCRRHGHLIPILLTDALGCKRCHHVFVVKPDGYTIEQCSAHLPARTWYWTGRRWQISRPKRHLLYLRLLFWALFVFMGILLLNFLALFPAVLPLSLSWEWQIIVTVCLAISTIRLGLYLSRSCRY